MSQDNNWQQQVWQQPAAPQQPVAPAAPYGYAVQPRRKAAAGSSPSWPSCSCSRCWRWACGRARRSCPRRSGPSARAPRSTTWTTSRATRSASSTSTAPSEYDNTTSSPEGLKAQLDRAEKNSHIKAVVLRVNSGGGTATAGEEMADYVRGFSERTGKPVVVSSASVNASAAYEISSQADYIYTAKTTAIGAIGTVMQVTDLSGLMEKLGISVDNVTSADSKDSSYGTRPLTEEERAYYQDQVDQINETFIQTVAEGRDMPVEDVRALATGLTFTGMTAVENGLADEIGTKDDAVAKAAELANIAHYTTVTLKNPTSSLSSLLDLMSKSNVSTDDIARALKELDTDGSIAQ